MEKSTLLGIGVAISKQIEFQIVDNYLKKEYFLDSLKENIFSAKLDDEERINEKRQRKRKRKKNEIDKDDLEKKEQIEK